MGDGREYYPAVQPAVLREQFLSHTLPSRNAVHADAPRFTLRARSHAFSAAYSSTEPNFIAPFALTATRPLVAGGGGVGGMRVAEPPNNEMQRMRVCAWVSDHWCWGHIHACQRCHVCDPQVDQRASME